MANIERLEQVIRVLRKIPSKRFDIAVFMVLRESCGTAGCAAGWAAADPWFRRRGFRLDGKPGDEGRNPIYRGFQGFAAVAEFFDLDPDYAEFGSPFSPSAYRAFNVPKREVIKRLREYIKEQRK